MECMHYRKMSDKKVTIKCEGGGYFSHIKPKFSACEESVFVAKKNNILQYSSKTGLPLGEYQGLNKQIVGFDVATINSAESLIACSSEGEVITWKLITRFRTSIQNIGCKDIKQFFYLNDDQNTNKVEGFVTYTQSGKNAVALANISKGLIKNFKVKLKGQTIFVGVSNKRYAAVADRKQIHFLSLDCFEKSKSAFLNSKKKFDSSFTCLECHSEQEIVITGDSEGKVILWCDIFSNNPTRTVYHWHTLPVNCLAFSEGGSYFYSGGNESVLVRWDWENTQNKKFLPRLSGYVKQIGVSNQSQLVAVSTSDNAVRILDSGFNDLSWIQHLVVGDNYECGITLDPRTKSLIMNGIVGQLQFYQPSNSTLLYSLDVVGQNKLTNERHLCIENTRVTKFAISKSGLWLATVEERKDTELNHQEMRLKFWNFDASQQIFELNTSIEKPHQKSVSSIAFQCTSDDREIKFVSVGKDKKFKVWHKTTIQQVNIDRIVWNALSVGFYRDLPCKALNFSVDGSLMGVGFGPIVTTWTPDTCELKCSLVYPGHKEDIENIQFGSNNQCHLVVACTKNRLSVWNLLTLTMIWTVTLEVKYLLADKMSLYMAVITENREIFIFSPNSPNPIYSNDEILENHDVMAAAFVPTKLCLDLQSTWCDRGKLYLIDSNNELFSVGIESSEEISDSGFEDNLEENTLSLYSKMIPQKKTASLTTKQRKHLFIKDISKTSIKKYLETPIHTMIPIRHSCSTLIKSFVIQKNPISSET